MTEDAYGWWREAAKRGGKPESESLMPGRYRRPGRDGITRPVAVWPNDIGTFDVLDGDFEISGAKNPDRLLAFQDRAWPFCAAVTEAVYQAAISEGRWADYAPASPEHNRPPEGLDNILSQLNEARDKARPLLVRGAAKSQEEADEAANLAHYIKWLTDALNEDAHSVTVKERADIAKYEGAIAGTRELIRKKLEPYDQPRAYAVNTMDGLKMDVIGPWLIELRRKRDGELKKQTDLAGGGARPPRVEPVNAGAKGQRVTVRKSYRARIDDFDQALAYFKDSKALRDFVQQLADQQARSKHRLAVPGVTFLEEYRV